MLLLFFQTKREEGPPDRRLSEIICSFLDVCVFQVEITEKFALIETAEDQSWFHLSPSSYFLQKRKVKVEQ